MYGTTQAKWISRRKKRSYTTNWRLRHTNTLKEIIDNYPDLYLDEIQDRMDEAGAGWWGRTMLWRKLKEELWYSLQVAMDKLFVANQEEQEEYQKALEERIIWPNQLIYIDKLQKDRNSSRCR